MVSTFEIHQYVCSLSISIADPTVNVLLESNTTRLPTAAPCYTFTLTCTASVPDTVIVDKMLTWSQGVGPSTTGLTDVIDNSNTFQITTTDLTAAMITSVLTVTETTAGDYRYRCEVELSDISVMGSADVYPISVVGEL